jgi:hypothetical protein
MANRALSQQTRRVDCIVCDRLSTENAALLHEYNMAIDALAATSRQDSGYERKWATLSSVSDRLHAAQKVETIHRETHRESESSLAAGQDGFAAGNSTWTPTGKGHRQLTGLRISISFCREVDRRAIGEPLSSPIMIHRELLILDGQGSDASLPAVTGLELIQAQQETASTFTRASCAICRDGVTGLAYKVSVGRGHHAVHYRCPACGRTWLATGATHGIPSAQ